VIVQKEDVKTKAKIWTCDCYEYYTYKWCQVTAAQQYKDRLKVDATKLPGGGQASKKRRERGGNSHDPCQLGQKTTTRKESTQSARQFLLPLPVTQ
jgi:hypothetical protein